MKRQGEVPNARLKGRELDVIMVLEDGARTLLEQAMTQLGLSARAYDKIRRIALTIADIGGSDAVRAEHIAEAEYGFYVESCDRCVAMAGCAQGDRFGYA